MTNLAVTNDLFFDRTGMDPRRVDTILGDAMAGMDDGELFLEYSQSESVALDDGRIKSASFDTTQGFGLRAVSGEAAGYAHASELSEAAIRRAATAVRAVASGHAGTIADPPPGTNRSLYTDLNPLGIVDLAAKTKLLTEIDAYARGRDPRVRQVMASLSGVWQAVQIVRPDGRRAADIRPLVRLNVAIVVGEGERMETGSHGAGGRVAGRTGRIVELRIGKFQIENPLTLFSQDKAGAFASSESQGNIGQQILSKFTVLLDYGRDRIILEPNASFKDPIVPALSGLRLVAEGADYKTFRVEELIEDSPATEAGIQKDDIILMVDFQLPGRPSRR